MVEREKKKQKRCQYRQDKIQQLGCLAGSPQATPKLVSTITAGGKQYEGGTGTATEGK